MQQFRAFLRWLTAISTVLLLVVVGWHCFDIYHDGLAGSEPDAIFTAEKVSARLQTLVVPLVLLAMLLVLTSVYAGEPEKHQVRLRTSNRNGYEKHALSKRKAAFARIAMLVMGIVFMLWGVLNGGMYDVFVKAINICTECIGLG